MPFNSEDDDDDDDDDDDCDDDVDDVDDDEVVDSFGAQGSVGLLLSNLSPRGLGITTETCVAIANPCSTRMPCNS